MPKKEYFCPVRDRQANRHPDAAPCHPAADRTPGDRCSCGRPPSGAEKTPGKGGGRSPGAGKPGEYPGRIPAETVKIMENMNKYAFPLAALLFAACNSGEETTTTQIQEPVATILEYTPAPGQFINGTMAGFDHVASEADALRYAADRLASNNWVSLGGWGGRIVAAFAEPVPNTGGYDLYVKGNQFDTSSEPGIVWVSQDANGDGAPNDTWYELRGSEYDNAETIRGYKITYTRPAEADAPVAWSDNTGGSGTIDRVKEHTQAYYPEWLGEQFTFEGTRLPDNIGKAGEKWTMEPFAWGYADNYSASDRTGMTNRLRISDAVTADGMGGVGLLHKIPAADTRVARQLLARRLDIQQIAAKNRRIVARERHGQTGDPRHETAQTGNFTGRREPAPRHRNGRAGGKTAWTGPKTTDRR